MSKKPSTAVGVTPDEIQNMVRVVRGQARLNRVTTSALNQAVQPNADHFPEDRTDSVLPSPAIPVYGGEN
jgi:hypothetical protein